MNRRALLAAALALVAVPVHAQAPAPSSKTTEVGKLFPYLANYLKLPAAERDRWTLAYRYQVNGKPAAGVQGWIQDGATRIPLTFAADGRAERLPTLAQIEAKRPAGVDVPTGTKFNITFSPELTLRPATELPAVELTAGLQQAARGARKAAPMAMRMMVPKFDTVSFTGAEGAEVVFADGRAAVLPMSERGTPFFKPADHAGARVVRFSKAPRRLALG